MNSDWSLEEWDVHWMGEALAQARLAARHGEVPVGAVIVQNQQLIGSGFNQPILSQDPTAHAEVVALRAAAKVLGNYRMPGTTLYVTLEPCSMCAGAIVHGRVDRLVFAATEPKAGVVQSREAFFQRPYLNHRLAVTGGVLAEESGGLLSDFFRERREQKRALRRAAQPENGQPEMLPSIDENDSNNKL